MEKPDLQTAKPQDQAFSVYSAIKSFWTLNSTADCEKRTPTNPIRNPPNSSRLDVQTMESRLNILHKSVFVHKMSS